MWLWNKPALMQRQRLSILLVLANWTGLTRSPTPSSETCWPRLLSMICWSKHRILFETNIHDMDREYTWYKWYHPDTSSFFPLYLILFLLSKKQQQWKTMRSLVTTCADTLMFVSLSDDITRTRNGRKSTPILPLFHSTYGWWLWVCQLMSRRQKMEENQHPSFHSFTALVGDGCEFLSWRHTDRKWKSIHSHPSTVWQHLWKMIPSLSADVT